MKQLFLALAMEASLAAPACAQSAATGRLAICEYGAPSLEARIFTPVAPTSQMTGAPDTFTSNFASPEAYDAGVSNPSHWKAFQPVQP